MNLNIIRVVNVIYKINQWDLAQIEVVWKLYMMAKGLQDNHFEV